MDGLIVIISTYVLVYFFYRNSTLSMITEIKINFRFYPKHYCFTPKLIQSHFSLKRKEIPRFLCIRLCFAISILCMLPIVIFVYFISKLNNYVVGGALIFLFGLVIIDTIVFLILSCFFKNIK